MFHPYYNLLTDKFQIIYLVTVCTEKTDTIYTKTTTGKMVGNMFSCIHRRGIGISEKETKKINERRKLISNHTETHLT